MSVTAKWYGNAFLSLANKEIDWAADDIRVTLHLNYTPDQDAHNYFDDVVAREVAATGGYVHMGPAIGTPTIGYTAGTNVVKFDGNDVTWASSTIAATQAVIWDHTPGADATDPLLGYVDFGGTVSSTSGDFTITWGTAGILTITPA